MGTGMHCTVFLLSESLAVMYVSFLNAPPMGLNVICSDTHCRETYNSSVVLSSFN